MRIALIGASSYQVFGLIDLMYCISDYKDATVDFYLVGGFYNCDKYVIGLKNCQRLNSVYSIKKGIAKTISHYLDLVRELLVSARTNMKMITNDKNNEFQYDVIVCENYFPVVTYLRIINPKALFYVIEDGVAPYYFSIRPFLRDTYEKRKKMYSIIKKEYTEFRVDGLYCYDPEYVTQIQNREIHCIGLLPPYKCNNDFWNEIYKIFGLTTQNEYKMRRIVAIDSHGKGLDVSSFQRYLLPYSKDVIVRPHPRKVERQFLFNMVDTKLDSWELVCAECITNDHVIIGAYSTAQFVPKILFDKEPWVLFTWEMIEECSKSSSNESVLRHIEYLKSKYRNPQKVVLIKENNQLNNILEIIMS